MAPNYVGHCALAFADLMLDSFSCNCSASGAINVFMEGGDFAAGIDTEKLHKL